MSGRIPSALEPYLHLPPSRSLTILTSILGTSINWLVLRFLYISLRAGGSQSVGRGNETDKKSEDYQVVLVSFLRDWSFWKEHTARAGLDLESLSKQHRLRFIDGLTRLFQLAESREKTTNKTTEPLQYLQEPNLKEIRSQISTCITSLREKSAGTTKTVLIIDNVDLLLAGLPTLTSVELSAMLLSLREDVHCMILSLAADTPLLRQQSTPLESQHSALVIGLAHQARLLMSARALSSGVAAEVSGVLRVKSDDSEGEWLYSLGKDGGVKVWLRGE